jgi:hypothetical protein
MALPELPDNIEKIRKLKDINGQAFTFTILDEIKMHQSDHPEKAIYLQKLCHDATRKEEIRICYYIIGKKPRMAGKWVFGQYATMMPIQDYVKLFDQANAKGWLNSIG